MKMMKICLWLWKTIDKNCFSHIIYFHHPLQYYVPEPSCLWPRIVVFHRNFHPLQYRPNSTFRISSFFPCVRFLTEFELCRNFLWILWPFHELFGDIVLLHENQQFLWFFQKPNIGDLYEYLALVHNLQLLFEK